MNRNVIIIGASGHGKVIADIVLASGDKVLGFLDDDQRKKEFIGFKVLGTIDDYAKFPDAEFVIAIGDNEIRKNKAEKIFDCQLYTAIHPSAIVSKIDTVIAPGTVIMPNAVINAGTQIGKHCIVNTGAIVEHDNKIGDFTHISVGAKLGGVVSIGSKCWIGIGACVRNVITICDDVIIGAGACVVKSVTEKGIYVGNPAKLMSH